MTREEAIKVLEYTLECVDEETPKGANEAEAIPMAIEALQADIVRCKDCKYIGKVGDLIVCRIHEISTRADDYCSRGERNKDE